MRLAQEGSAPGRKSEARPRISSSNLLLIKWIPILRTLWHQLEREMTKKKLIIKKTLFWICCSGKIVSVFLSSTLHNAQLAGGFSLIFQVRGLPSKRSHSNFPTSPPASSWQLWDAGCNNEGQQRASVSAFSFGHSAHACLPEPRGLSESERAERLCSALISDIAGQDVNCTSRMQFVRPASSVLSWLVFWQRGGQVYTSTFGNGNKKGRAFF